MTVPAPADYGPAPADDDPSSGEGPEVLYRIPAVMRMLSLSRSVIFEQLRSGRLDSVRQGRARLIPASAITEYIALLKKEATQENAQ
jgi:excisionase family DNA binding protein